MTMKPLVGISSCLVGQRVRYDGDDKLQTWITEISEKLKLHPVCPEFELGMGVPREKIQLEWSDKSIQLVAVDSRKNWTTQMSEFAKSSCASLEDAGICGFIFKSRSPSCGIQGVTVHGGEVDLTDAGRFSKAVAIRWPDLPLVDEAMLASAKDRETFVSNVIDYHLKNRS